MQKKLGGSLKSNNIDNDNDDNNNGQEIQKIVDHQRNNIQHLLGKQEKHV